MDGPIIRVRYDGGDADHHTIDMRLLGESLIGVDRIVSDGLIVITHRRVPKRGERAPLLLKAKEPVRGSVDLLGYLQEASGLLPLGLPFIAQYGADLIWDWFKGVIAYFGGRRDLAETCMEAIIDLNRQHLAARDASEQRTHEERRLYLDALMQTMQRLGPAAAQTVAPIGPSARRLGVTTNDKPEIEIDEPLADALREHGEVEIGDLQEFLLRTDGFTFHTRKLSVEHPERGGYLLADVQDPIFEEASNPYTLAAEKKAMIRVKAKPGYRSGRLEKLYIMDFGGVIDDAA
jgi:hypothetical protein